MRKLLYTLLFVFALATTGLSQGFPGTTNTATVSFGTAPDITKPDWKWRIMSSEDSTFVVTLGDISDTSSYGWQFRMKGVTGEVLTVANTNITTSSATVTWQIFPTNMPPAGTYQSELRAYITDTNGTRAVAGQGTVTIVKSLFE